MNDTLGGGLLYDGNGPDKALSRLIHRIIGYRGPQFLDRFLYTSLVTSVSQPSYFALLRPLKG